VSKRGFTLKDAGRMAEMYRAGATLLDVAVEFDCSTDCVRYWLLKIGEPMRRPSGRRARAIRDESALVRAYLAGVRLCDLKARFGVSYGTFYKVLRRNGVTPNRQAPAHIAATRFARRGERQTEAA